MEGGNLLNRKDVRELHYICHIFNIPSILELGILSHNEVQHRGVRYKSVADAEVQDKRAVKYLHDYANLYFDARNPMMYVLKRRHTELVVLRLRPDVLDIPESLISNMNAARKEAKLLASPDGISVLDKDMVYANSWVHPNDYARYYQHKGVKCAEVLVPQCVSPDYIIGAYVSCKCVSARLRAMNAELPIDPFADLFFYTGGDEPWLRSYPVAC